MEGVAKIGIDLDIARKLGELVKREPFVDIRVEEIKMPHGSWSQGMLRLFVSLLMRR